MSKKSIVLVILSLLVGICAGVPFMGLEQEWIKVFSVVIGGILFSVAAFYATR